ncbi:MAG TPA: hypothetical protein DEG17_03810 [Cyanobacteria bacterium UBA11149]|nr:hypothetical protein [Cyanobacteria bacterium UBA11367]HBE58230.1 hypothetical protein [Cyanobacteria bacterium UBA11366]HBK65043.1 hypothetical protein [Cyanobacteria bacterium UBA11166]HBR76180.1 hypothetical protein [Cyanobacteria bacterium UBA11159]HBS70756.1 hypothetical protein [Cyanobacteria bacterium UBA11153]HBW88030.1 hypothetical protein [Cyanobacteria bacterium UBA11149]HCA95887.1 hypothetical protein [Cyanobacteria bacterium UBA9226]
MPQINFKCFSELHEFIRRYNATSFLEIGTNKCWAKWETKCSNPLDWVYSNAERNYAVRIMLLASAGSPYKKKNISVEEFNSLINAYYNFDGHTISNKHLLDEELKNLFEFIKKWEIDNYKKVRNWSFKLSDVLDSELIRDHVAYLDLQRQVAFQNSGFGYPISRIQRTIKFIELLDKHSNQTFSDEFFKYTKLPRIDYFKQILGCLGVFGYFSETKGFCNFSDFSNLIDEEVQKLGITPESLKLFVKQNSAYFFAQTDNSFRSKINKNINMVPRFYQLFFYNQFLEVPFIELSNEKFCLPDPFSFTESCWNQIRGIIFNNNNRKRLEQLLSRAFEDYIETVLLPLIIPQSFEKLTEVENPRSNKDKRADFLITTSSSYIVLECKSSIMSAETSSYFHPDKLAELWCRIHSAVEQIRITVEALKLQDKPVIPLIMTFYDSIAASSVLEEMIKQTDYCSRMGLNMPPVVYSLHEFEHWISDRSINNWAELILSKQHNDAPIKPDNKGHNYDHLKDICIL